MVKKLVTIASATVSEIQELGSLYHPGADYAHYLTDSSRRDFSIRFDGKSIGFALINQVGTEENTD